MGCCRCELNEPVSGCEGNVEVNGRMYLKQGRSPLYFGQTDQIATKRVNKLEFRVWDVCAYRKSIVTNVPFDRVGRHEATRMTLVFVAMF